jgi:hypothetical protein
MDGLRHEGRGIVGDLPGEIVRETLFQPGELVAHGLERGNRIGTGRLIDRDRGRRPAIKSRVAIEIGGAELHPRDIAQPQHRSVGIGAYHHILEVGRRGQAALGLDVQLQLLLVRYRPRADASDGRLDVLRLNGVDDVAGGQAEAGQPVGPHPGAHRVVLWTPQCRIADAGRAPELIEKIDRHVVGQKQRIVRVLRRIDGNDPEQCRRLLLDRDPLTLHVGRQAGQRNLNTVVDVDRVDVRIGAELEGSDQRVAAVIAADALHVDHLVDADDLRLDRLRDGGIHDRAGCARVERRDGHLRRNDIGVLRDRDGDQSQDAGDRRDDGDDDRQPRPVDKNG